MTQFVVRALQLSPGEAALDVHGRYCNGVRIGQAPDCASSSLTDYQP